MRHKIEKGDYIEVKECRPLSKIIHFCVVKKIRSKEVKNFELSNKTQSTRKER